MPVDTLKELRDVYAVMAESHDGEPCGEQFGRIVTALDAAIAALDCGEAVAWRIYWGEPVCDDYELTHNRERVEGCRTLKYPPRIEPLYAAPRAVPDGAAAQQGEAGPGAG